MSDAMEHARQELDEIDDRLLELLAHRMRVSTRIGRLKADSGEAVIHPKRLEALLSRQRRRAARHGIDPDFAEALWRAIHEESCRIQAQVIQSS